MVQYWLENESGTVYLRLDESKAMSLVDGFAVEDHVGVTEMVWEAWDVWLYAGAEGGNAGRVAKLMGYAEQLNRAWRIAADAIERRESENMVWLHQRRHGLERRLLVGGGRAVYAKGEWPAAQGGWVVASIDVKRHPCVEDVPLTVVSGAGLSCMGGVLVVDRGGQLYSQTTAVSVAPARLARTLVNQPNGVGFSLETVWLGIHPGGDANLDPTLTLRTDAGASRMDGGSGSTVSFATNNEHQPRLKTSLGNNTGDISQLRGRWRVLLRAKTTGGAALVTIQMAVGNVYTNSYIELERDYINTGGDWKLLEMGEIELPPEGYTAFTTIGLSNSYAGNGLFLLAGCENTGMSLELDRFILIPARHMVKCTDAQIQRHLATFGNAADRGLHILTQADDTQQAVVFRVDLSNLFYLPSGLVTMEPVGWALPPEGGAVVVAACLADDVHDTSYTVNVQLEYHARHYTL